MGALIGTNTVLKIVFNFHLRIKLKQYNCWKPTVDLTSLTSLSSSEAYDNARTIENSEIVKLKSR